MEKKTAHYSLGQIQELIRQRAYRVTRVALKTAAEDFGLLKAEDVARHVLALQERQLYKSMTTLHDNTLWQDVYHSQVHGKPAYIKVQVVDSVGVVISFKHLE